MIYMMEITWFQPAVAASEQPAGRKSLKRLIIQRESIGGPFLADCGDMDSIHL